MQRFVYKAKTNDGKTVSKQIVEARDVTTAVGILREKGLVVISIHSLAEQSGASRLFKAFQRVKLDDVVAFTRQMATMMSSGLPLTEALSILEIQSKPVLAKVVGEILRDVQGGSSVADALEKHREVFGSVYISLVRAGEAAGALDDVLKRLAENLEKEKDFRAKTKGALIYPVIVFAGMIVVTIIMMVFVVPKLAVMYEDFDAELPLPTQVLIWISNAFTTLWPVLLVLGIAGFFGFGYWKRTEEGSAKFDEMMIKMPVFGKLRTQIMLAEMTRTMGLLVGAGISLIVAIEIVNEILNNKVYQGALDNCMKNVKKGVPFSVTLARQGVFPPLLPNMVAVGEETGKMDEVLLKVSKYFEEEAEHMIKGLTTALEPLIMIVLGVGVGFLVISIIMPIYNLTNQF